MSIEVKKETFDWIFSSDHYQTTDVHETYYEIHYSVDGQRGSVIHNHVSNVSQYYLYDINI